MLYTYDGNVVSIQKSQVLDCKSEDAVSFVRNNSIQNADSYLIPNEAVPALFEKCGDHLFTPGCSAPVGADVDAVGGQLFDALHSYQVAGVNFLLKRTCALLGDCMGLGKTLTSIAAMLCIASHRNPALVACPASLTANWQREFMKWTGIEPKVLTTKDSELEGPIAIVSYDTLPRIVDREDLLDEEFSVIVCDESHRAKNPKSRRATTLRKLTAGRRWLLTGTPMLSTYADVQGLCALVKGEEVAASLLDGIEPKDYSDQAHQIVGVRIRGFMMRRTKDEVLELPDKHRHIVPCNVDFTTDCAASYMRKRSLLALSKAEHTANTLKELVGNSDGRGVLCFSNYKKVIAAVGEKLKEAGLEYAVIDGSMSVKKRQQVVNRMQLGLGPKIILGQILAAGEGLTITQATKVVFADLSFLPAQHNQAEDRAYRIGQDADVDVYYVVANNAFDKALYSILERKTRQTDIFLKAAAITEDELTKEAERVELDDDPIDPLAGLIRSGGGHIDSLYYDRSLIGLLRSYFSGFGNAQA